MQTCPDCDVTLKRGKCPECGWHTGKPDLPDRHQCHWQGTSGLCGLRAVHDDYYPEQHYTKKGELLEGPPYYTYCAWHWMCRQFGYHGNAYDEFLQFWQTRGQGWKEYEPHHLFQLSQGIGVSVNRRVAYEDNTAGRILGKAENARRLRELGDALAAGFEKRRIKPLPPMGPRELTE